MQDLTPNGHWAHTGTLTNGGTGTVEFRKLDGSRIDVSASTTYTFSVWAKQRSSYGTRQARPRISYWDASGAKITETNGALLTLTTSYQRQSLTFTTPSGTTTVRLHWDMTTAGSSGESYDLDGVQLEQQPLATPYVETSAGTASRAGSRVQGPAGLLDERQGWIALRFRPGWGASHCPAPVSVVSGAHNLHLRQPRPTRAGATSHRYLP